MSTCSQSEFMFQVSWILKFEVVRVEKSGTNYFNLLAVRAAMVKQAVKWVVKMPLGRVQEASDYMRFLS